MIKNISIRFAIISCALMLFVGCGVSEPDAAPDSAGPSGAEGVAGPSGTSEASEAAGPSGTSEASDGAEASGEEQYIGSEAAKQAALEHAGLNVDDVRFVHADLELDDGSWKYDVEFYRDNIEYDYDIDALTGAVLSFDQDAEYYQHEADASIADEQITEEQAKQIALGYASVAEGDVQRLKMELDHDNGRAKYEVEWHVGQVEYSCDVDAYTGEILSYEEEPD